MGALWCASTTMAGVLRLAVRTRCVPASRAQTRCMCSGVAPVNIHKGGTDPPILPDDQYPEWLHTIAKEQPKVSEFDKRGYWTLTWEEQKRYHQLVRRSEIKSRNALKSKK